MSMVLKQMKQEDPDGANIVFLDACRDNPFAEELHRTRTRAAVGPRGLSAISGELARGTLIAFATDPNSTAQDGVQGGHSPFTEALLHHLPDPGSPIDTVMTRVRTEVWEKTNHTQRPWVNTSLTGEFSFNPQAPAAPDAALGSFAAMLGAPAAAPPPSAAVANLVERAEEKELWESAEHSNLGADYQFYLERFPNGMFAPMARNRIASLSAAPTTTRTPDDAPPTTPAGPSEKELKAEIGTMDTEKSLRFGADGRKEIQERLQVLRYYTGTIDGTFNEQTRTAIAEWQKKRQVAPTGNLGPVEVAALRAESEEMYQRYLDSQPQAPNAQPENPQATPSVQAPATGYHQYYHYQPYHYYHYQAHYPVYHYARPHRHYYGGGGGYSAPSIMSFFHGFGLSVRGACRRQAPTDTRSIASWMGASERMFQIVRATNTLARLIAPGRRNRFFPLCNCELQRAPTIFPELMESSQQGGKSRRSRKPKGCREKAGHMYNPPGSNGRRCRT